MDPHALPLHRLVNWLHVMALDSVQWAEDETRQELSDALEWPDKAAEDQLRRADEDAHNALAKLGLSLPPLEMAPQP